MSVAFQIAENPTVEVKRVGLNRLPIWVVDGVFAQPDAARAYALQARYNARSGQYPGVRSVLPWNATESLIAFMHALVGVDFETERCVTTVSVMTAMGPDLSYRQRNPHIDGLHDPSRAMLVGLAYLNLPEQCRGGTAVYRHRETGFEAIVDARAADLVYTDPALQDAAAFSRLWERIYLAEMQFNRLIAFDSTLLHMQDITDGDFSVRELHKARLTYNFRLPALGRILLDSGAA